MADTTKPTTAKQAAPQTVAFDFAAAKDEREDAAAFPKQARSREANPFEAKVLAAKDSDPRSLPVPNEETGLEGEKLVRSAASFLKLYVKTRVRKHPDGQWRLHYLVTSQPSRGKNKR